MSRFLSRKTNLLALLAVLVAGGAVGAIVAGSGSRPTNTVKLASAPASSTSTGTAAASTTATSTATSRQARAHAHRAVSADQTVAAAARYLGLSIDQLRTQLRTGRTLAEIAQDTPGHSEAGLVDAVLAAQQARLAKAGSSLPAKVKLQVQVPGGPRPGLVAIGLRPTALAYLGLKSRQLRSDQRSGESLAQIAAQTPGKSEAGLIAALLAVRKAELERARDSGAVSAAVADARLARVQKTIEGYVHRERRRRPRASANGAAPSSTPTASP